MKPRRMQERARAASEVTVSAPSNEQAATGALPHTVTASSEATSRNNAKMSSSSGVFRSSEWSPVNFASPPYYNSSIEGDDDAALLATVLDESLNRLGMQFEGSPSGLSPGPANVKSDLIAQGVPGSSPPHATNPQALDDEDLYGWSGQDQPDGNHIDEDAEMPDANEGDLDVEIGDPDVEIGNPDADEEDSDVKTGDTESDERDIDDLRPCSSSTSSGRQGNNKKTRKKQIDMLLADANKFLGYSHNPRVREAQRANARFRSSETPESQRMERDVSPKTVPVVRPPTRRGRGRPRKFRPENDESITVSQDNTAAKPVRRRGRPPKIKPENPTHDHAPVEPQRALPPITPPRRRGHPPKYSPSGSTQVGTATPTPARRGRPALSPYATQSSPSASPRRRGRPPKNPVPAAQPTPEASHATESHEVDDVEDTSDSEDIVAVPEQPQKRKRGRPRKYPLPGEPPGRKARTH